MLHDSQTLDIMDLIDRLESQFSEGRRMLGTRRIMVDEGEFLALIDHLRNSVPMELLQARRVIQDRQQIILEAQEEAEKIVSTARDRAEYLISEKGLTAEARYRSEDVLRQARERAQKTMGEVDGYARRVLDQVERTIRQNLNEIEHAKSSLSQQP